MPLSAGGFFSNLFSLDPCMAYCEVAHPEKRPTPIFPAQALSDGQILLQDVNDLDDLPVQRLRNPAYERIR